MPNIPDELSQFIDLTIPQRAREAYTAACAHLDTLRAAATKAEAEHAAALAARSALARQLGAGEPVTAAAIAACEATVRDAAARVTFTREGAAEAETRRAELDRELVASHGVAHVALLDHGIGMRIEAAGRLGDAIAQLQAAEAAYSAAEQVIRHAHDNGVPMPSPIHANAAVGQFGRHTSAAQEATFWGRPALEAAP